MIFFLNIFVNMSEIWNLSTLCRCCHSDGSFKNLNLPYQNEDAIEIYDIMLQETFGIKIIQPTVNQASYTICDICIKSLREASRFREQVLACEQKFKVYFTNEQFLHSGVNNVKAEVESNETEYLDMNTDDDIPRDDDCLQTNDCDRSPVPVKEENKNEVDLSSPIVTKDEKTSVKEDIEIENKMAAGKKGRQRVKPEGQMRQTALSSSKKLRKFYESYIITKNIENVVTYSCKNCEGTYNTKRAIYKHIHTHHRDRCKCEQCGKSFILIGNLVKHIKKHNGNKSVYVCRHCGKKYDHKYKLNAHEKTHTDKQTYKCDICQKELRYKTTLRKHILYLHTDNNKAILCDVCGRSFNQRCNLEAHIKTVHLKLRPYSCTICGKTYTAQKHVKSHMKVAHCDNPKPYQCDVCTKSFACPKYYKIHKLTHDNHFSCRYCSDVFDSKKDLEVHKKTHAYHLNNPYSCHICGKVLLSRFTLNRHVESHSGIRRFSCDICGLKFTQKALLQRHHLRKHDPSVKIEKVKCDLCKKFVRNIEKHMDTHDVGKRKFFCDLCGKNYPTNNALNRHKERKHYGVSYDCDVCGKKYIQKGSLQRHKLKIHKIKKEN